MESPSANLQMCGFLKELISAGRKVFFCFFFFWGFGMCCYYYVAI